MKIFSAELAHNYDTYTFGYANYCEREAGDRLEEIYNRGYLPYSGGKGARDLFYMARSARINLSRLNLDSENRRIAKKYDGMFSRHVIGVADIGNTNIRQLFLDYFERRHGAVMPAERLDQILSADMPLSIIVYHKGECLIAVVIEAAEGSMGHFWFSAFSEEYDKASLGLWLILDSLREARQRGLQQYYLGTVYGEKALYKTNFAPLEWWDGSLWNDNSELLKLRGRSDNGRSIPLTDAYKIGFGQFN